MNISLDMQERELLLTMLDGADDCAKAYGMESALSALRNKMLLIQPSQGTLTISYNNGRELQFNLTGNQSFDTEQIFSIARSIRNLLLGWKQESHRKAAPCFITIEWEQTSEK